MYSVMKYKIFTKKRGFINPKKQFLRIKTQYFRIEIFKIFPKFISAWIIKISRNINEHQLIITFGFYFYIQMFCQEPFYEYKKAPFVTSWTYKY